MALNSSVQADNLMFYRQRLVNALFENFHHTRTAVQTGLRRLIKIGTELGERLKLTVLSQIQTQGAGNLLHRFDLCRTAYTGYGDTDVDRRTLTGVEQVGFKEDLAVSDRDYVRRNVS